MKILGIIFLVTFLLVVLFGKVEIHNRETNNIFYKAIGGIIAGIVVDIIIGLPLLGLLSLLGF